MDRVIQSCCKNVEGQQHDSDICYFPFSTGVKCFNIDVSWARKLLAQSFEPYELKSKLTNEAINSLLGLLLSVCIHVFFHFILYSVFTSLTDGFQFYLRYIHH